MQLEGRFGRLVVVGPGKTPEMSDCVCLCGARVQVPTNALLRDGVQSCGCRPQNWKRHPKQKNNTDLTDQRFGRLVAIRPTGKSRSVQWETKCDCGNTKIIPAGNLLSGNTRSCGCMLRERLAAQEARRRARLGLG